MRCSELKYVSGLQCACWGWGAAPCSSPLPSYPPAYPRVCTLRDNPSQLHTLSTVPAPLPLLKAPAQCVPGTCTYDVLCNLCVRNSPLHGDGGRRGDSRQRAAAPPAARSALPRKGERATIIASLFLTVLNIKLVTVV